MGGPFRYVGGAVALLGHHLGPKWSQKRQDESPNSDLGLRRGGQGVSEALMGLICGRFSSCVVCCVVLLHVFCKKGFVRAVWYLDLDY